MGTETLIDTVEGDYDAAWATALEYKELAESEGCTARVRVEPMSRPSRGGHRVRTGYAVYLTLTEVPQGAAGRLAGKVALMRRR